MNAYVRFQTGIRCADTGRPGGIFVAAGKVADSPHTPDVTREYLQECLSWFNHNLPVPATDECGWRCLFWFRSDATPMIDRIWDLIAILQEEGVFVRKIWSTEPGAIKYRDAHQIAAVPTRHSLALRV